MSELSGDEVQEILSQWAADSKELPPPVRDVYDAWYNFRFAEIKSAIEAMSADDDYACEMGGRGRALARRYGAFAHSPWLGSGSDWYGETAGG